MEPEEYEILMDNMISGYDPSDYSDLADAAVAGDIEKILEYLPYYDDNWRVDAFDRFIMSGRRDDLSTRDIMRITTLLLQPETTADYLLLMDAIQEYPADYFLPIVKYAKNLINPDQKLRMFEHTTIPVVRELLDYVEVDPTSPAWAESVRNKEVLTYLLDMGIIPLELWEAEYGTKPKLPNRGVLTRLIELYL